jgi:hypothetical protein
MSDEFDPKIIGYLCNWCHSVFFFIPQSAGFGSKEKNGSKRNSPKPAPSAVRRWDVA